MEAKLYLDINPQPDSTACGPTCLHAIYRYFDDEISLNRVVSEVKQLRGGGTLAVYLGSHALARGYKATIYTYNLQVFDPTWFSSHEAGMEDRLKRQLDFKRDFPGLETATLAYLEFLKLRGRIGFEVLTAGLLRRFLKRSVPVLTGLSATYLYNCAREYAIGKHLIYDDIQGESTGHFVVLAGYDKEKRTVLVADPLKPNPVAESQYYEVSIDRLVCAIMLGVLTYDGDLLVVEPRKRLPPVFKSSHEMKRSASPRVDKSVPGASVR